MNQIPGLRHRVEETLGGVVESAVEFARLSGQTVIGSPSDPMRLHVGNYVVWYYLDAANASAKVVYIELISRESQGAVSAMEPADEDDDGSQVA